MAKLTIPENEVSSLAARARSGSIAVLPPIRKVIHHLMPESTSKPSVRTSPLCPMELSAAKRFCLSCASSSPHLAVLSDASLAILD